ncbi:N-acetyl-gamma-glutamyl-phosphate reductase [uncultured Kocuria sp.]|uniref:N-acetyl-gamma-glutamyl-phosphate reductase n=1 Tax=uncultured Kocuria sp. TaxID=259305 RepID=UPI002593D6FD|nr:N-acetyl-gamma-glutamyl-phosphate reductase [uncultured Kocuria sp.]MCT1367921.1 N-acetyl-gamma-glutamyl-phosphate reductase [Rothia sp. p3-SID1597]
MTFSVAVSGATGYAGGEVLRLLAQHPHVEVTTVAAHSQAGARFGDVMPHLRSYADMTVQETSTESLSGHDVVFLALPHGASASIASELPESTLVIDAGADHRLRDPEAWKAFYGTDHAGHWPYGLPELVTEPVSGGVRIKRRSSLVGARRIAVPGCYPTGAQLALAPGLAEGLIQPEDIVIVSASGTSGAGKSLKPHLQASEAMSSMSPYGVGGVHRHVPEIEQGFGDASGAIPSVSFTPTLAPMPRGILTTATARLFPGVTEEQLREAWQATYEDEPFVHLLPEGQWPTTKSVQGSNHVVMQLAVDERAGRLVVTSAIDNLVKGTAGGAIQSMNIALGLPETTGLTQEGLVP